MDSWRGYFCVFKLVRLGERDDMNNKILLETVDFGHPEAEHDISALRDAFYESEGWRRISTARRLPFLVGRKGSGKSALATKLEIDAEGSSDCFFIRIVPDDFRHVEIRGLLSNLVTASTTWQYIYGKVWEGILLGQIVRYFNDNHIQTVSNGFNEEIEEFEKRCGFYVAAIDDALSDVIAKYVRHVSKKTDELTLIELRKMLEPYNWGSLVHALIDEFKSNYKLPHKLIIAIDGLDEHWDISSPSLYFLAQLLAVTKKMTAKCDPHVQFLVCLRDNIFRALVDTKSIEYDKLESLVINLQWNSRSLFELIARRVAPKAKPDIAIFELRELLPDEIEGIAIDEYLGRHVLNRPRDYVNIFRMLQSNCGKEPRAGESHVRNALEQYCSNRLVDLDNEFGLTYPGISKCVSAFSDLEDVFSKDILIATLSNLISEKWFRTEAADLVEHYGHPITLSRILVSIGVVGCYDSNSHALRFIHEFSESRVSALWDSTDNFGIHPVYRYRSSSRRKTVLSTLETPAIVTHPSDYLPSRDAPDDLEAIAIKRQRKVEDLIADLPAIEKGQPHFHRWEAWVKSVLDISFPGELVNSETQIKNADGSKRFEIIYDIAGGMPPWAEMKEKHKSHRLLVECKNTEIPTDSDFNKLIRDMDSLDLQIALLAYRGAMREPTKKMLEHQRSRYNDSKKTRIILAVSEGFLLQCLQKKTLDKRRQNLNSLWRDHMHRWLI